MKRPPLHAALSTTLYTPAFYPAPLQTSDHPSSKQRCFIRHDKQILPPHVIFIPPPPLGHTILTCSYSPPFPLFSSQRLPSSSSRAFHSIRKLFSPLSSSSILTHPFTTCSTPSLLSLTHLFHSAPIFYISSPNTFYLSHSPFILFSPPFLKYSHPHAASSSQFPPLINSSSTPPNLLTPFHTMTKAYTTHKIAASFFTVPRFYAFTEIRKSVQNSFDDDVLNNHL